MQGNINYRILCFTKFDQFTTFEYLRGYLIYITNPSGSTLIITGQPPTSQTLPLKTGWNLISSAKSEEKIVEEALRTLQLGVDYSRVCRYNPLTKAYENYTQSQREFTTFKPAEAYYIKCLKDTNWTVEP